MPTKPRATEQPAAANFVFQGTVQKVKAVTMPQVPVSDRTAVVRVDRLIEAPEALSDYGGQEITVQVPPGQKVKAGQTFIFYTNGWIFGDSLAVQVVKKEDASASAIAALSSHPDDPVQNLQTRAAKAEAVAADLIVSGRVTAVRLPEAESQVRATTVAAGRTTERISEHAPLWQEAVIDLDDVHKGQYAKKQVVVRFPASTDVRWRHAPKFHTGQEGVFLLHKDQMEREGHPAALAGAVLAPDEYTALHTADFQPLEELPHIILAASAGGS
jgi:hypothetical protein